MKPVYFLLLLLWIGLMPLPHFGQGTGTTLAKGIALWQAGQYTEALAVLEPHLKEAPSAEAYYYAGICQVLLHESEQALDYLVQAQTMAPEAPQPERGYWMGLAYYYNFQFPQAEEAFQQYLSTLADKEVVRKKEVKKLLEEVANAQKHYQRKRHLFVELLPGTINTRYYEHSPVLSQGGHTLYYTSSSPANAEKSEKSTRKHKRTGKYYEDIMVVEQEGDNLWHTPEHIMGKINSHHHEGIIQLFDKDRKMLVFKHRFGGDIFVSESIGLYWDKPRPLKGINSLHAESNATITPDGKTIIFASNRDSREGRFDLFISHQNAKGRWSKPEKLGSNINTPYDEDTPYLTADGQTLYFSSTGHNTLGGFDVFKSTWDAKRKRWSPAENLGAPVNSVRDDLFYRFHEGNDIGYFASNRAGGMGNTDIYQVRAVTDVFMEGTVQGEVASISLNQVYLYMKDLDHDEAYIAKLDEGGNFMVPVESGTHYRAQLYTQNGHIKTVLHEEALFVPPFQKGNERFQHDIHIVSEDLAINPEP